jgi:hypothetical protein
MTDYVRHHGTHISFPTDGTSWVILSDIEQRIKEKIERAGKPLKDWDINIYRGLLTGCNEAFIINKTTRDELIAKCPKSVEIICPILRGRDIERYKSNFADMYLINVHNGNPRERIFPIDIKKYPAVKDHLDEYWEKIKYRDDQGVSPYNLRSCAYMDDFYEHKIVWARLMRISKDNFANFPRFAMADKDMFVADSLCFITGKDLTYLLIFLNSEFAMYYFLNNIAILDNGGMQMRQQYVELMPIPTAVQNKDIIIKKSKLLSDTYSSKRNDELNDFVYEMYGLSNYEKETIKSFLKDKKHEVLS